MIVGYWKECLKLYENSWNVETVSYIFNDLQFFLHKQELQSY